MIFSWPCNACSRHAGLSWRGTGSQRGSFGRATQKKRLTPKWRWGWVVKLGDAKLSSHLRMCLVAFLPWFTEIQHLLFFGGVFLKFFPFGVRVGHPSTLLNYGFDRLCEFATLKPIAIPLVRPEERLQDHLEGRIWLVYCITTIFAQRALNHTSTFYSLFQICDLNSQDNPPVSC